jgi:hypothetical protein
VPPAVSSSDVLNRLTTISWRAVADLTKALSAYYQHPISTRDVYATITTLEHQGLVIRRPRQEADGTYGAAEYQLTAEGARVRVRLGATDYDPFAHLPPR